MAFELFIANRYLRSKRKTGFVSLITYISIIGVTIGVAALIIVLSVMNGFESEVRSKLIGFGSHLEVRTYHNQGLENYKKVGAKIQGVNHIVGMTPYINEKALIISKNKRHSVAVKGIDPETVDAVSDIRHQLQDGTFNIGTTTQQNKTYPGIILGTFLAEKLAVKIGQRVQLLSPSGISAMLSSMPRLRTYVVTGLVETGIYEFDDVFAYVSIREAQRLFELKNTVSGLEVKLDDLNQASLVAEQCKQILGYPHAVVTWFEMNRSLFSWMTIQKWGMFVVLSLITMVAAFNIVSTLIMIVLEKTKEIGVLKAMGASARAIKRIFVMEGLICGVIGTLAGSALGFLLCWVQLKYQIISLPPDVYIISSVPVLMSKLDFIFVGAVVILLCYLAAVYPARYAARLDPVESIRYG